MTSATLLSAATAAVFTLLAWMAVLAARPAARRLRDASATRYLARGMKAGHGWVASRNAAPVLVLVAGAAVVVALGNAFAEITDAVTDQDDLTVVDRPVLQWLAQQHSDLLTRIQIGITNLGSAVALIIMLTLAATVAAIRLRSWRPVILTAVAAGGIQLLVFTIKVTIGRARPDPQGRLVEVTGFSFPSGHSASALACFGMLAWLVGMAFANPVARATAWVAAALLTVAIGASRAYLGVHYPSDIMGGWVLGAVWLATVAVVDYLFRHRPTRIRFGGAATQP